VPPARSSLGDQQQLFTTWQHFAFITNRGEPLELVEREHREHAVLELVIRDLVDQALRRFPSGRFNANAAWTVIACPAHNLHRSTELLGLPDRRPRRPRTLRRRLLALPGRLTRTARRRTLHPPARWPRHADFLAAPARIHALPAPG
jgi:DDE family transposase